MRQRLKNLPMVTPSKWQKGCSNPGAKAPAPTHVLKHPAILPHLVISTPFFDAMDIRGPS